MNTKKTTNRDQFMKLVAVMRQNADVARNMTKRSPESLRSFWVTLKVDLDSLGPPIKEVAEWKKVWSDFKSAVRKKLAAQIKEVKSTGGGPNKKIVFSPLEEEVADFLNIRSSMTGLPATFSFGAPAGPSNSQQSVERDVAEDSLDQNAEEVVFQDENHSTIVLPTPTTQPDEARRRKRRFIEIDQTGDDVKVKTMKLVEQKTELQKKFCDEIIPLLAAADRNLKEVRRTMDQIYREKKTQTSIMKAHLEETKRHNEEIKKIAVRKAILKERILELQIKSLENDLNN